MSRGGDARRTRRAWRGLLLAGAAAGLACAGAPSESRGDAWFEAGRAAVLRARELPDPGRRARNVVLFVGDGMGVSTVTAARILDGQLRGEPGEENVLAFERLPFTALAKTYNTNQQTPDSAGTMTALVTGSKTRAGVLSVDASVDRGDFSAARERHLETILERAEARGLSTGVVTTATVTHATPAACYAHSPERAWEVDAKLPREARRADFPDIARQLVEFPIGDGLEVALGGGRRHFLPAETADPEYPDQTGSRRDGRHLADEWAARRAHSAWVWNASQLAAIDRDATHHLLGLFEPGHMRFETDRAGDSGGEPSLAEMTALALDLLSRNPKGFFLMVEGGRIDHGHHIGNAYRALTDAIAFDRAVAIALEKTSPSDTLVVVTADHGHVFTMAGYATRGNPILGLVVGNDEKGHPEGQPSTDALGLPYTTLGYANGPGWRGGSPKESGRTGEAPSGAGLRPDLADVDTAAQGFRQEATVPLSGETHSGEDVVVYAGGPGAWLFRGVQEQSYFYHAMVEALGWNDEPDGAPAGEAAGSGL